MISNNNINSGSLRRCVCCYFLQYNKTIIGWGFCDILNNQGLGNYNQPRPSARLITLTSTLIIPDFTKTLSNNCLIFLQKRPAFFLVFTLTIRHFVTGHLQRPGKSSSANLQR